MRESKECAECGGIYFRGEQVSEVHWGARKYCSVHCAGIAGLRRMKELKAAGETPAPEVAKMSEAPELAGPFEQLARRQEVAIAEGSALEFPPQPKEPVLRELRIVRVGPNPRLVVCEYFELAERRLCTVQVKRTEKFVRGMKFKMVEPADEMAYRRPWVYQGPPPRHRGRW